METLESFLKKFDFRESGKLLAGIERECHLLDASGKIAPVAPQVLAELADRKRFGYELSACQLEDRIGPVNITETRKELEMNDNEIESALKRMGFSRSRKEVGPLDMPLDVYPDPTGRYQKITKRMPREILLAACRVIGTHVHIGMPDHETALTIYNETCSHFERLCEIGNGSSGKRLELYKLMAPDFKPRPYSDWNHFFATAIENNFADDPRKCWTLIRISVHGTLEFRMFGTTEDLEKATSWATDCHGLCKEILADIS